MCIFNVNLWAGHDLLARVLTDCPPTCPMARDHSKPAWHRQQRFQNRDLPPVLGQIQMAESKVPDDTQENSSPRITENSCEVYEYWFSSSLWPYVTTSLKTHETIKKYLHFTCIADLHWFAFSRCCAFLRPMKSKEEHHWTWRMWPDVAAVLDLIVWVW